MSDCRVPLQRPTPEQPKVNQRPPQGQTPGGPLSSSRDVVRVFEPRELIPVVCDATQHALTVARFSERCYHEHGATLFRTRSSPSPSSPLDGLGCLPKCAQSTTPVTGYSTLGMIMRGKHAGEIRYLVKLVWLGALSPCLNSYKQ
jgi:hypothetical protein